MRIERTKEDYETIVKLQRLYTAKRRLAVIAEGDKARARALGAISGVRDAAMMLFGEDVLTDITL